jgi:BirA family biotin operon repressor/biotin-[acetyl-CoA-carboxylase] ligase
VTDGTTRFGAPRRHYRICDSTNERLRGLAQAGAPGGTVVTADEQSAGRGRQGRTWTAPAGTALLCSALLRPLDERHALLPLAVPLAVCDAVESLAPVPCAVKWPNDVLVEGRKAAGILIEARPQDGWAAIGIGLNLSIERDEFPAEVRDRATSVGHDVEADVALEQVCGALAEWVGAEPHRVLEGFRRRDALRGRRIEWANGAGVADGVDEAGNLLVTTDSGEHLRLGAGEVHLSAI